MRLDLAQGGIQFRRWLGAALLLAMLLLAMLSRPVWGQMQAASLYQAANKPAVGVAIYYGWGEATFAAPPPNATPDEKAYSQLLTQGTHSGEGPAVGFSYGSWGLIIGRDDTTSPIHHLLIDGAGSLVTVNSLHRINTSITLLFSPYRYLYIGLGHDTGTLAFQQTRAGTDEVKSFGVDNNFYTVALAFGFDPHKPGFGPLFTVYAKTALDRVPFAVNTNVVGVGLYF